MRLIASSVAVIVVLVTASAALARRGSEATLSFEPNDAPAWSTTTGTGCGYAAGQEVYVDVQPEALAFTSVLADDSGCMRVVINTDGPGTYHVSARQLQGKRWVELATYELPGLV